MNLKELINESILSIKDHLKNYSKYFGIFYKLTNDNLKNTMLRIKISDKNEIEVEFSGNVLQKDDLNIDKLKVDIINEFKKLGLYKDCKVFYGHPNLLTCRVFLKCYNEIQKNKLFRKIEDANLKLKLYYVNADEKFIILNNNVQAINLIKFLSN